MPAPLARRLLRASKLPLIAALAAALPGTAWGRKPAPLVPQTAAKPEIRVLAAGKTTNVFVLMGEKPILVDTGWGSGTGTVLKGLAEIGLKPTDLALIVCTHGHGDHAGGAAKLRELSGAKVVLGAGDVEMTESGHNRKPLHATLLGTLLKPITMRPFPAFTPDIAADGEIDLAPYGVEGRIVPTPGHTPGSLSVVLADGDAIVGDLVRGSLFAPHSPRRHYYHDDCAAAESHLQSLVDGGTTRLFVGHGGPLDAKAAAAHAAAHPCGK